MLDLVFHPGRSTEVVGFPNPAAHGESRHVRRSRTCSATSLTNPSRAELWCGSASRPAGLIAHLSHNRIKNLLIFHAASLHDSAVLLVDE